MDDPKSCCGEFANSGVVDIAHFLTAVKYVKEIIIQNSNLMWYDIM